MKYQAPVQIVFTSVTLSGSLVNHIRRYMKKNLLGDRASRIFESENNAHKLPALDHHNHHHHHQTNKEKKNMADCQGIISRLSVPSNIKHYFYIADTVDEQVHCLASAMTTHCRSAHLPTPIHDNKDNFIGLTDKSQ